MGHRHSRERLLDAALEVAQSDGLHRLSFGRVAQRAGASDRIVVYYFPDKTALVTAVLDSVGELLRAGLAAALEGARPSTHHDVVALVHPIVSAPEARPLTALYVEALGLAAAGVAPYAEVAAAIVSGWENWLAERLEGPESDRRAEAAAALALVDGLLVLGLAAGPEAAERAALALGITRRD